MFIRRFSNQKNPSEIETFTKITRKDTPYTEVNDAICMIGILPCWLYPISNHGKARNERFDLKYSIETHRTGAIKTFGHLVRCAMIQNRMPKRLKKPAKYKPMATKDIKGSPGISLIHQLLNTPKTAPTNNDKKKPERYLAKLSEIRSGTRDIQTKKERS
jgi:hypothetical protein